VTVSVNKIRVNSLYIAIARLSCKKNSKCRWAR